MRRAAALKCHISDVQVFFEAQAALECDLSQGIFSCLHIHKQKTSNQTRIANRLTDELSGNWFQLISDPRAFLPVRNYRLTLFCETTKALVNGLLHLIIHPLLPGDISIDLLSSRGV